MPRLSDFGFNELIELRSSMRSLFTDATIGTFGEAADRMTAFMFEQLVDDAGRPACALARIYKTHLYGGLDADLKKFALHIDPAVERSSNARCLVLAASRGEKPSWNSPAGSRGHRAIPLTSEAAVAQAPMIASLIRQFGLDIGTVLNPTRALLLDSSDVQQGVFHVPTALGSPFIPAQDEFVKPYGVESVLGFGGILASGDLVAMILFSRVPISAEAADHFKVVGLNFKLALLPYTRLPLFSRGVV